MLFVRDKGELVDGATVLYQLLGGPEQHQMEASAAEPALKTPGAKHFSQLPATVTIFTIILQFEI